MVKDWVHKEDRVSKFIFYNVSVLLIALNIVLFENSKDFLLLSILLILSITFIGLRFKTLFIGNKKQDKDFYQITDQTDMAIVALGLFFFICSRLFSRYEEEFMYVSLVFILVRIVKIYWTKKKAKN